MAARKKFVAARVGDGFLVTAVALLYDRFGTGDLGAIFDGALAAASDGFALGSVELAAACFGVTAILKSAQFPTHGWLVEVMDTPTPQFRSSRPGSRDGARPRACARDDDTWAGLSRAGRNSFASSCGGQPHARPGLARRRSVSRTVRSPASGARVDRWSRRATRPTTSRTSCAAGVAFDERFAALMKFRVSWWGRRTCFDVLLRAGALAVSGETYRPDKAYLRGSQGPSAGFEPVGRPRHGVER